MHTHTYIHTHTSSTYTHSTGAYMGRAPAANHLTNTDNTGNNAILE